MRWGWLLIFTTLVGGGGWYVSEHLSSVKNWVDQKTHTKEVSTLEIRFSAEEIMRAHQQELLKSQGHTFLEPMLSYVPYLWMEVKYAIDAQSTEEGIALWGLSDGELVLDANTWEKTHGYEDCLIAHADPFEFSILNTIAAQGGSILRETLYQSLSVDSAIIDRTIKNCEKKKLLFVKGDLLRLHFNKPKLARLPVTSLKEEFVVAPSKPSRFETRRYTATQITKLAQNAFGSDFTIRRKREVFVPIYTISVQNPDGSVLTTQWSALNGQRLRK